MHNEVAMKKKIVIPDFWTTHAPEETANFHEILHEYSLDDS